MGVSRCLNHGVAVNRCMVKNLRADMSESEFHRFKALKAEMEAKTNDEAIVELMDSYESDEDDTDD